MPRYIDAEKIDTRERGNNSRRTMWNTIKEIVDSVPTADVQEVVRCKDCIHFCPYEVVEDFDGRCTARGGETDQDDFCNYGEKRGDEK